MATVYLGTDPKTAGEWHTSKFDKRQYCGSCEEFFAFNKDKITPKYLDKKSSKDGSTVCRSDISSMPHLNGRQMGTSVHR